MQSSASLAVLRYPEKGGEEEVYFKLEHTIRQLHIDIEQGDSVQIAYDGPHQVNVFLRFPTADEQKAGHKRQDAFCTATSQQEPSASIHAMFESLADNRVPAGSEVPDGHPHFDREGRLKDNYAVPFEVLPEPFRSFAAQVRCELEDHTRRTILVLRWRYALSGQHNPFSVRPMEWSFDGQVWKPMPSTLKAFLEDIPHLRVSEKVRDEVMNLVVADTTEPLAHSLYREAWQQRHHNPRSALVVGIAAAEIGVKEHIIALVPDAQWMVENAPSPPLVEMLRSYLPQLPAKCKIGGEVVCPPDVILDWLKKGVTIRNKIVHVEPPRLTYETLEEVLLAVCDVLWILDYYRGFEWALDNVRPETRNKMEAECR